MIFLVIFSSVQSFSPVQLFATPWIAACQAFLSITNPQSLLKLLSIELVIPSNHLILCHPLLLLPSIFASIRVFSNESVLHIRWPKYRSFSFSISPSNEYSGLISYGFNWFDLLAVQGTLKSLGQDHNLKASILWCSAFFIVQFSHPYMTTGKTIALTKWTFVDFQFHATEVLNDQVGFHFDLLDRFFSGCSLSPCHEHSQASLRQPTEKGANSSAPSCESAILETGFYQAPLSMDFPGKNTGVGCHFLLQGIFQPQELNLGPLHCKQILYPLSH